MAPLNPTEAGDCPYFHSNDSAGVVFSSMASGPIVKYLPLSARQGRGGKALRSGRQFSAAGWGAFPITHPHPNPSHQEGEITLRLAKTTSGTRGFPISSIHLTLPVKGEGAKRCAQDDSFRSLLYVTLTPSPLPPGRGNHACLAKTTSGDERSASLRFSLAWNPSARGLDTGFRRYDSTGREAATCIAATEHWKCL